MIKMRKEIEDEAVLDDAEAFEAIGKIDDGTLMQISEWYTYRMESKSRIEEQIKIEHGLITTYNNRTFVDAVIANDVDYLAFVFIATGNYDSRLYELDKKYVKRLKI